MHGTIWKLRRFSKQWYKNCSGVFWGFFRKKFQSWKKAQIWWNLDFLADLKKIIFSQTNPILNIFLGSQCRGLVPWGYGVLKNGLFWKYHQKMLFFWNFTGIFWQFQKFLAFAPNFLVSIWHNFGYDQYFFIILKLKWSIASGLSI